LKNRIRLDGYIHKNSLSGSLEKARKEILTGWVKVNGETVRDPAREISGNETIRIARPGGEFTSRGGYKLDHALKVFNVSVADYVAVDLGASTGGFTDCLLRHGAAKVYAVDNGYGVLAYELRTDPRVVAVERTNVRNLKKSDFTDKIDFLTVDLSFISVLKIISNIKELFLPVSGIILLKPQFEAEDSEQEKGVVKNKEDHIKILERIIKYFLKSGIGIKGLDFSPIKGPAGNIEFLMHFSYDNNTGSNNSCNIDIIDLVEKAHKTLNHSK
jgi:23S rRNA (cytidine1920-2'-O)/16S rRNA (cytidine1409-2'-O)-methyltransferase